MVKSTRQKHARNQEYRSLVNVSADFNASTARKLSLSALTTVLTAATCLGGQPLLASSNILLPPTTAAFAEEVRKNDPTPWLHTPNILEYQRYRYLNSKGEFGYVGDDKVGDWDKIISKTDMYAHVQGEGNNRYMVFDVFFNNDGKSMVSASTTQQYVWQIPYAIADLNNGGYKGDTMRNLRFDFYKRNNKSPQTYANLSHDIGLFEHDASRSFSQDFLKDSQDHNNSTYHYSIGVRPGRPGDQDIKDNFHVNPDALDSAIKKALPPNQRPYNGYNYGIGITTTHVDYAVHMHCELKLRPDVTDEEIKNAFTWANSSSYGRTTHSAYTFISGRTKDENVPPTKSDKIPPKLYFNGKEISDSNNSITVYQGDIPTITFGTSDDSGKVNSFSVKGLPNGNGDVTENSNGMEATEAKHHNHVVNRVKFEYKNGNTPANTDYTVTVSATDASGNKVEKKVTVHLKNLNQKYKEPTATPITVDWGHKLTENDLKPHVTGIEGGGQLVFNPFPPTNIPQEYFNGKETLTTNASAKVVYSDNSYHVVTIPVNIKKPLSLQHKLNGNTVNATVGDPLTKTGNKVDAKQYLGNLDDATKKNIKSAEWVNGEPSTDVAGKRTYTAKVTFSDGSTAEEKVTFTVRPQKPKIETDLTGVAGVKNKEVVVNAGPGTEGSTVTLKDNRKNAIGTGKVGADGKVTIKVADGIPAGNVTAVTSTNPADPSKEQSVQSPVSDPENATKDEKAPTLTGPDSITVKVGEDLKIQLTAKDDVKIESIDTATATMAFARNDLSKMMAVAARAKTDYTTNTDKEKVFTYSFSGFKPEEVDTYTLTFSATDAAGHKTEKTVTVKVEKKEDIKSRNITVDLGHKLTEKDAEKAIADGRKLKKAGAKFAWSTENGGTPDTSTVGKEKSGKVIVTIPTNDPKHPRVETVAVKVTVKDNESPKVAIQQKGEGGTYNTINGEYPDGPKHAQVFTITTYRGDKNDIKITATDNSGKVTTLTLTPKTPGETEKTPTGTGTTADPKTLTLDGTTPLNTEPGEYKRTITAVDPSGNTTNVSVKFVVKTQADKYSKVTGTPVTYNMSSGTTHPDPKSGIDPEAVKKLPKDAKYSWAKEPDWNKPGKDTTATVRITFPDGSTKDVETKVTVKDNIAPVIEKPATNQVKHDDKQMYYQFKVHKDKPFDIEIKSYDNSGKIKSAEFNSALPTNITGSNISIADKDNNSAEKPAKITITGTAKRADNTNPDANKWSRDLIVKDEAGNESRIKVQISVYTDAEEHTATASKVNNPASEDAIKDAIKITKYDAPNTPIDKTGITFEVGKIPTDDGNYTVPVTVKYPDGSSSKIEVPIVVNRESNNYDPVGRTITVHWNSKEDIANKIKSFGDGNGLTWNGNSPKQNPTVEIVNTKDVPSTDKPGESKVQVKVKYSDGSSDVATVTVKVLDPQNKDYTPEGQTIKVDYSKTKNTTIEDSVKKNGIKLKKNGADTTLPTDATVTIDSNSTIPDGTQPGDFTVPVTITYGDGSTDHATVTVKVGEPQNKKYEPNKPDGINVGYGKTKPSDNDIIAKVKFDDKNQPPTDGTKITVDDGQTPIDTTTPGTVNVKVTVKYPDGSEDHVEVPVTVGNPDNVTHKASATPIELKRNKDNTNKPSEDDIKKHVTTDVDKTKKQPTITVDTDKIPTTDKTGTTNVPVTIKYEDGTTTTVQVPVIVTDTNADEYTPNVDPVEEPYGTGKEKTKEAVTAAVTVPDWPDKDDKAKPQPKVTITSKDEDIPDGTKPGTYHVNVDVEYPDKTVDKVTVDVTIKNKQSDTFEPKAKPVVKPYGTKVTSDDVTKNVTVPDWSKDSKEQPKIELNEPNTKLPDGKTPGNSTVKVKVTYPDGTTDTVDVPVTISNKQSELYPPKADNLEKDNGQKPSDDEIIGKVSVPTWPTNETNKPTYSIAEGDKSKIPNGDKAGKFEVPVTVTYPDGSTIVINVPVTIKAPTATAKVVTVPKGVEPKPEDSIANKDKFPEGTQFEWKKDNGKETGKPDTSSEGNKSGIVVVTVPGQAPVEVPVTVNVVDQSAPQINVPQGKDLPKPEDVINGSTDKTKYPEGTKFEWSKEDTPDTKNPGTKNGKIIVTIPGQDPVKVPVTVNVLPKPEANVVNVPLNGTLPEAKDVIKDSTDKNKFPNGTTFEWEDSGKPTTDTVGEKTGGKVKVTIPGVNGKSGYTIDVPVTVNVNPAPIAKETSVAQNSDPDPKNSIKDNDKLPEGTTFEWKKDAAPKTDKPGTTTGTVIVKIPGQEPQEVPVKITVTASPEGKDVTVLQKTDGKDNTPQPKDVIKNNSDLPENAKTSWKKKPDTSKTGNQPGIVTVKVPGEPDVDIPVNVLVVPNPAGKTVSVHVGDSPSAENSIANKDELPNGTKFAWATNGTPDTKTAGNNKSGTVVVTIPGIANPVNVPVTVNVVAQNKPFINGGKAENTPDKSDKTTITGKTQPGNTVTVKDNDGNTVGTGDANKDGNFTIEIDKKDPGTTLKLVPNKGGVDGDATTVIVTAKPQKPTITVPTDNQKNDGNVTVTPPTGDTTVVKIEINAKPNSINGPEQPVRTIIAKKDNDGKWKIDGDAPDGVTVDPKTGVVTIPAKNLEDGSTITAVSKNKTDKPSDPATAVTGFKTPQISEQKLKDNPDDSTKQIITGKTLPGATVTVTDKDGKQIGTGVADKNGNFTITINKQTPGAIVNLTPTNGTGDFAKTGNTVEVTVGGDIAVPRIDTPADGSATITPNLTDTRIDKVVITYTPEGDGSTPQTVTITVIAEGDKRVWKIDGSAPNGVTVDPNTGVVTIPASNVKDGSTITAVAKNSGDSTAGGSSSTVTGTIAQPGDGGSGDSGSDDDDNGGSSDSGSHDSANNANNANNAKNNGNKNDASSHNGSNNHGNQSRNSGSNSGSRRGKGALGNTGVGVALSALASAMLAGMGAAGRAVSRRKKRN